MRRVFFVYTGQAKLWSADIIAHAYADCFRKLGFEAHAGGGSLNPSGLSKNDFSFSMGFFSSPGLRGRWSKTTRCLVNVDEISESPRCLRQWEDAANRRCVRGWGEMPRYILDWEPTNKADAARLGSKSIFCPLGYHENFEFQKEQIGSDRYDIGFVGFNKPRNCRPEKLKVIDKTFNLLMVGRGQETKNFIKGKNNGQRVLQADMLINLFQVDYSRRFRDVSSMVYGFSNKRCVLNEGPTTWAPPLEDGVHWINRPFADLLTEAKDLKRDPERRGKIAEEGYQFVKTKWRLEDHVEKALKEFEI